MKWLAFILVFALLAAVDGSTADSGADSRADSGDDSTADSGDDSRADSGDDRRTCSTVDTVFTECTEGIKDRWKVTVSEDQNCSLPPPVKIASCDMTCKGGEFLENFSTCQKCSPGTYSRGSEMVYGVLDKALYPDISYNSQTIDQTTSRSCRQIRVVEGAGLAIPSDKCYQVVNVPVEVARPGNITVNFIHTDSRAELTFYLKGCNGKVDGASYDSTASMGSQSMSFPLAKKNSYLLQIKSTAFLSPEPFTTKHVPFEDIIIGQVTVTGVAPATKCTPCPAGTFAPGMGNSVCKPCPANTRPSSDRTSCKACPEGQWSAPGSGVCREKEICGTMDYSPTVGQCTNGKSTIKGVELFEGKCSNDQPDETLDCLTCQPGSERRAGKCVPCKEGMHSSGTGHCSPCQPNSLALKGQYNVWWTALPDGWIPSSDHCWEPAGPFLLGKPHNGLPISLTLGRVQFAEKGLNQNIVGLFSLKFSLNCQGACSLLVIQEYVQEGYDVRLREVVGRYIASSTDTVYEASLSRGDARFSLRLSGDPGTYLQLNHVNFTNTATGGSSYCFPCQGQDCKECAPGMVQVDGTCTACPAGTRHVVHGSRFDTLYSSSCEPCPPQTTSEPGSTSCHVACGVLTTPTSHSFDLSSLGGAGELTYDSTDTCPDQAGNSLHFRYRMQLCGPPLTQCESDWTGDTRVCKEIVATRANLNTTHPQRIGETVGSVWELHEGGLELVYMSSDGSTAECPEGLTTAVTLTCNRDGAGTLKMTNDSPCRYAFQYTGKAGCRQCQETDFNAVTSECDPTSLSQNITYVLREGEVTCVGGTPPTKTQECEPYQATLVDSLRRFKVYVMIGTGMVLLLLLAMCFLAWYSSTLRHQLDGYSRLAAPPGNGADNTFHMKGFGWQDSDDEEEDEHTLYTRYETPGKLLASKLSRLNSKFGLSKKDDKRDLMDPNNIGI